MRSLSFFIAPEVAALVVRVVTARIHGIQNPASSAEFDAVRDKELDGARSRWEGKSYKDDPVLQGFRELHSKVGRSNRDYVASPEVLRRQVLERGRFPHINTLVDIYNLASLQTGLALGAHDVSKIVGDVTLRLTTGDEMFVPLGGASPEKVFPSEYAYVDDGNNIICRMEVLQVEPTKVTVDTHDVFLIVQGNLNTSQDDIARTATSVCQRIVAFCGGTWELFH